VDFYTLVIEWGATKIDLVEHAISGAPVVYEHLLGVVLNKVDIDRLASYEGSRRKYYLNKQYTSYGFID
jgi:succinoglycan biosynthesis transport protein ExoP